MNLTPQQMQQMQAIRQRYQGQMQSSRQSLRQAHQELQQLMASDAPVNQIRDKHRQVQQLRSAMADLQLENMLEMREVLTLQQRQMLNQRMQQRRRN
uniref:Periplasmic heavy metal sensor n=1 Tax=Desertifilum tharense IPPAS B-1220 TaxID=1781255 RepID=A0ACD5GZI9_9CYAN